MNPVLKYRGGKSKEISYFSKYLPDFSGRFIEPFFGGGAVYFYLEPEKAIINDINEPLISFYRDLKNNFTRMCSEINELSNIYKKNRAKFDELKAEHPHDRVKDDNEDFYYKMRNYFNHPKDNNEYLQGSVYYFINKTAYSGMIRLNSKGEFNVPFGRYKTLPSNKITDKHHNLLLNTEIYNKDFAEIFKMAKSDDFIFLDPPYDCIFSDYGNSQYKSGFGDEEHRRLANELKKLSVPFLMVIAQTELTSSLYQGMIKDTYEKKYAVNIRNRFKSEATHMIVTNY